jgi:hypothetical protein
MGTTRKLEADVWSDEAWDATFSEATDRESGKRLVAPRVDPQPSPQTIETRETRETPTVRLPRMKVEVAAAPRPIPLHPTRRVRMSGYARANAVPESSAQPGPSELQCLERIGPLTRTPFARISPALLKGLELDPRAVFLISRMGARATIETLLDVCGMAPADALRILYDLACKEIIGFR